MRHIKQITVAKAQAKQDVGTALFFQIYFSILAFMISAIVGGK